MSLNQSRTERSDSSQYRKSGRSGGSAQPMNFSGSSGKGGWTAPPPSSSASATSNRRFKKSNNARGQSRASGWSVNSDSSNASASHTLPNGSHSQPPVHGFVVRGIGVADAQVSGVTVRPPTDTAAPRSVPTIPKSPSSQPAAPSSEATAPATPVKAPGDSSRAFPSQSGSISPGFVNGMQIPARTSSVPPDLDEQKLAQARHDSSRAVSTFPIPSVPKQQFPKKDGGAGDQSNSGEAHQVSKGKREVQISSAAPLSQIQKAVHPMPGVSLPMPFPQPQVPVQFGGASPQIQSQGMTASSFPLSMPIPPQLPQQVYVPGLQAHPMQPQGIIHRGQGLNFTSQMGPQLTSQLGNLNIPPQFAQQRAGKFGGTRKPVKITHPDPHEELRLDKKADSFIDGVLSTQMSHSNVPQSQPITSVPPYHAINYYPNYNPNSIYFSGSSVSLTGNQITPSSQAPRFSYPLSQGPQTVSFMNPPSHSYSNENLVISTSLVPNATNTNTSVSSRGLSTYSESDTYFSISDSSDGCETVITKSVLSNEVANSVSTTTSVSQPILNHEGEGTEDINAGKISVSATLSKDKPAVELSRSKSVGTRRKKGNKKILREILTKADAAGTTSDFYSAYWVPEGKKDTVVSPETMDITSSDSPKRGPVNVQHSVVSRVKGRGSKAERDDWEDAADISTSKLETVEDRKQVHGALNHLDGDGNGFTSKKYSRNFLLKFKMQYVNLPEGFQISSDVAKRFMFSNANFSRESYSSPGRVIDKPSRGSRSDQRGSVVNADDKWIKLPGPLASGRDPRIDGYGGSFRPGQGHNYGILSNPRAQARSQYAKGILAGPMQSLGSQGGMQRNTPDSDRWQRATGYQKGLIPCPQTPLQIMHKAEKKYEVGKATDEEEGQTGR
ncbi:hypothetical protein NMG60_11029251 [Bertholletia excelsa]